MKSYGQISIGNIEEGPYGQNSTISVPISIDINNTCFLNNNKFELYISDATGNLTNSSKIGEISGFYSTFINGKIPSSFPTGDNYKLKVVSTSPAISVTYAGTIKIRGGNGPSASISTNNPGEKLGDETFGWCGSAVGNGKSITFNDDSNPPAIVILSLKNELTGTIQDYTPGAAGFHIENINTSYYTITVKAERLTGGEIIKSTKSYLLLNSPSTINISTDGFNYGCLDPSTGTGAPITYIVDTQSANGIKNNYPGSSYRISWGDGQEELLTHCDLINRGGILSHSFMKTSCGEPPIDIGGGNRVENAFRVSVTTLNPVCQSDPTSASTYPKIYLKPVAKISPIPTACTNTPITFTNNSSGGNNSNCSEAMQYKWYVDGVLMGTSVTYTHPGFSISGLHTVKLVASNDVTSCSPSEDTKTICIQAPPQPAFNFNNNQGATACAPAILKPNNTSVVDETCDNNTAWNWSVEGGAFTFGNGTNAQSMEPEFNFSNPGIYKVSLTITTASCGDYTTPEQTVVINTTPAITLSPDITVCSPTTYDFNDITTGPTRTTFTGTSEDRPDTYTWTITGGQYAFEDGYTENSKYPSISFKEYATYTVAVTHQNNCGTETKSQEITFTPSPQVSAGENQIICHNDQISLNATVSGSADSYSWTGGAGTFSPNNTVLNPIYTPTQDERNAGVILLTFRATTGLAAPCDIIEDEIAITIRPLNSIISEPAVTICTGASLNYTPAATTEGSSFTWTATGSANAGGFASGSGSIISDQLTNSDPVNNATVTYTITPQQDGCSGEPFIFIATVTPIPVLTATPANNEICNNQSTEIALSSTTGNVKYTWTSSATGSVTGNSQSAVPGLITEINDVLFNGGDAAETATYIIIPISEGGCSGQPVSVTISVEPSPATAEAGPDESICSSSAYTLKGNQPARGEGKWTLMSGQPGVSFSDDSQYNATVTGLEDGEDYIFRWTITGTASCGLTYDEVIIKNLSEIKNLISSTFTTVCSGQAIVITGDEPAGGDGTYTYSWESSEDSGGNWTTLTDQNGKDLNTIITNSVWLRRVVNSSTCNSVSNNIQIIAQPPVTSNSISSNQAICAGITPNVITGSSPAGGDGNYRFQWQSSLDNGVTWNNIEGAVFNDYTPPAPVATTNYRRLVSTSACAGNLQNISNTVTITVNPGAKAEFSFVSDKGCVPFVIDDQNIKTVSYPDRNASYTWYANNVEIGAGLDFPGYTISSDNESVEIKLVVSSSLGCAQDEMKHVFSTQENVTAAFTQSNTEGCGPLTVNFVNTSSSANASFKWDFGNGNISSQAQPAPVTYLADPSGKDTTYTITLQAITSCGTDIYTSTVFVKAQALAAFSPDKTTGCSPMQVTFSNTSPGGTNTYYYDFGDGTTLTTTDKDNVQHTYITNTVKDFVVKMIAENDCGRDESQYTIRVSPNTVLPELVVNSNENTGCAPLTVTFYNNSRGANAFNYDFGDGNTRQTRTAPETVIHTFNTAGVYTVTLTASNGCSDTTTTETITVLEQPGAAFTADQVTGCKGLTVQFTNASTGGVSYLWEFGDGETSTDFEPVHIYQDEGAYTVKLTATNSLGCTQTTISGSYINIVPPPVAAFGIQPGIEIAIPDYTFRFYDESTGSPGTWEWDFGDGSVSATQNPDHTYADTGTYRVALKVFNQYGCTDSTYQLVRISGVPGYLYIANSFMPGNPNTELREFKAKGSGIESWKFTVFNKWGQVLWETTELEEGRPVGAWDGTYKSEPVPQGVYYWKIDVKMVNGTEWKGMTYDASPPKRTGAIHLIR